MSNWLIALVVMAGCTLASHLGLTDEAGRIISKIMRCPKCLTFWTTVVVLVCENGAKLSDMPLLIAISLLASMASLWFGLALYAMSIKYNDLWQAITTRKAAGKGWRKRSGNRKR